MINTQQNKVFDKCFRSYYQVLCYFSYHYLKDTEKAEDIVQDVFLKLLNENILFDNEEHIKHYLYKAVRNSCLNHIKLTGIRSGILESIHRDRDKDENNFFANVVRAEVYREIMKAIRELPHACVQVFQLAYVDGYSNEEIASQLSISINTVKVQKNKAKIRLRQKLQGLYPVVALFLPI